MRKSSSIALVPLVAVAVLAAGCGGGSPKPAAGAPPATTTVLNGSVAGALAFARCMRAHGIPGWPDPSSDGGFDKAKLLALGVSPSRIRSIEDGHCRYDFEPAPPPTRSQLAHRLQGLLAFARCMRGHGVDAFPDPTTQGELSIASVRAAGVDLRSPVVQAAAQTCLPASDGVLTAAQVQRAEREAG
ncbi:MAG: hypothetical protein ABUS54_11955 [Actinomycetota bacterium]